MTNNAAERGVRGIALGRKSWLFVGSNCGEERAAIMYSPIVTAKLNGVVLASPEVRFWDELAADATSATGQQLSPGDTDHQTACAF